MSEFVLSSKVVVRQSTEEDVFYLADHLREQDEREIWASDNLSPFDALSGGYQVSHPCFTITYEGRAVAMFGAAATAAEGVGTVWLLASDELYKIKYVFIKFSKFFIREMLKDFEVLYNFVHAENYASTAWLMACGAKVEEPKPHGKEGELFHLFTIRRDSNV